MRQKDVTALLLGLSLSAVALYFYSHAAQNSYVIDQKWNFQELSQFFQKTAKERGARYAFKLLEDSQLPPNTDLHLLGHFVGDILYSQEGIKGIETCTPDFRNACSHSIVVGHLLDKGELALADMAEICKLAPGGRGAYTMCFHGLGHGILAYTGYQLERAIQLCDTIGTQERDNRDAAECVGGTIMEIIGGGFHNAELWAKQSKIYLKQIDPLSPCNAEFVPGYAKNQCYTYITPHLFRVAGGSLEHPTPKDFEAAFRFCETIPENDSANRAACNGGFGKEFILLAKARNIQKNHIDTDSELSTTHKWCSLGNSIQAASECVNSAVLSLHWGGENSVEIPIRFCNLADATVKDSCFKELIGSVGYYEVDARRRSNFCKKVPIELKEFCLEHAS